MSLFFITVPENQYKLIYCIPNEIANSVDRSGNLNRLFSEVSQDFQSFCSTVFFEAWDRHVRSCTSFWQFSNSVYHFLKYCTLTASSPYLYQLAVNFMGEVFATRRNQIAIRTASVDQVSSFVIVHQLIPPLECHQSLSCRRLLHITHATSGTSYWKKKNWRSQTSPAEERYLLNMTPMT